MLRDRLATMGTVIVFMQLAGIGLALWLVKHHNIRWADAFGGLGDPVNSIAMPMLASILILPAVLALHFVSQMLLKKDQLFMINFGVYHYLKKKIIKDF